MLVASQDGYLYVYQIPTEGGECQLIKKHDLRNIELPPNPPRTGKMNNDQQRWIEGAKLMIVFPPTRISANWCTNGGAVRWLQLCGHRPRYGRQ